MGTHNWRGNILCKNRTQFQKLQVFLATMLSEINMKIDVYTAQLILFFLLVHDRKVGVHGQ